MESRLPRRARHKKTFARGLRQSATPAERKLWALLRGKKLGGVRFRRQQPIGSYIVDFYCARAKLVIELDGGQHSEERNLTYDEDRSRWMGEQGIRVMRFSNDIVLKHADAVLEGIALAVESGALPLPEALTRFGPPS